MSDSDVIKEFLVGLGFKLDEAKLKKFTGGIAGASKAAFGMATAAAAMAAATVAAVVKMSERFEELYYLSQRVGASASNISAYAFAFEQVGGSAEGAKGAIEAVANFMKFNPGGERFLQGLGVSTRDANGQLRDTVDIMFDLSKQFRSMPLAKANVVAQVLGIDSQTMQVMMRDNGAFFEDYKKKLRDTGTNQEEAAAASARLMQNWRSLLATLAILADKLLIWLVPALDSVVEVINDLWDKFQTWKNGSGSIIAAEWGPELAAAGKAIMALFNALMALLGALMKIVAFVWDYMGPAIKELAHGGLRLLTSALNVVVGVIRMIVALLTGDWAGAWRAAKGVARDTLMGLVDFAMSLVKSVKKVWYAITHKGADMPEDAPAPAAGGGGRSGGGGAPPAAGGGAAAGANDNAPLISPKSAAGRAIAFFMSKGWSREQAAGIAANLQKESAWNHRAIGDGGKAFGLGQWHPDRQAAFKRWAGKDIRNSTFEEQLAFVHYEMTQGAEQLAGKKLRGATTASQAGAIVSRWYERPKETAAEMAERGRMAEQLFRSTPLGGKGGAQVSMNQTTNINVTGGDAGQVGRVVAGEQDRVNGNMVRNLKTAVS